MDIDLCGLPDPATIGEVAAWMRVGDDSVREPIKRGEFEAIRINRRGDYRIYHSQVRKWLASRLTTAEAQS